MLQETTAITILSFDIFASYAHSAVQYSAVTRSARGCFPGKNVLAGSPAAFPSICFRNGWERLAQARCIGRFAIVEMTFEGHGHLKTVLLSSGHKWKMDSHVESL